jgi:hypothetical protein
MCIGSDTDYQQWIAASDYQLKLIDSSGHLADTFRVRFIAYAGFVSFYM